MYSVVIKFSSQPYAVAFGKYEHMYIPFVKRLSVIFING